MTNKTYQQIVEHGVTFERLPAMPRLQECPRVWIDANGIIYGAQWEQLAVIDSGQLELFEESE